MPLLHGSRDSSFSPRAAGIGLAVVAVCMLAVYGKRDAAQAAPDAAAQPPAVGVVVATPGDIGVVAELPGRLEASRVAEVRARAAGILQQKLFREGSDVKAGQPLFRIDPEPYAAAAQSAQASLERARANAVQAQALADRYKPLVEANAVSKQEYVNAMTAQKVAEADVAVGRASLQTAKINLGYANVTAPISGRIGRALVTEGALVGQGDATKLALVQQIDPIYVNFTQPASEVLKLRRAMEAGQLVRTSGADAASVRIVLEDGSEYKLPGRLLFADLSVDASTSQVMLRAEVPNPNGELLPGLYVRVRIEQARAANATSVPQQAVTRTHLGDTLMVVGADGKVTRRRVLISAAKNDRWIVLDGLQPGEQVVVDGFQTLQRLPPGTPVKPVPWKEPGKAASLAAADRPAPATRQ